MGGQQQPVPAQTNVSTKPDLPGWLEEGLHQAFDTAWQDYSTTSPDWEKAWGLARDAAGGPSWQTAVDLFTRMAQGDFLYGGEGFNAAVDAASRKTIPQVLSRFAGSNRTDGGLAKAAIAQAISDPFALQYGREREAQNRAAALLPQLAMMPSEIFAGIAGSQDQRKALFAKLLSMFGSPFVGETKSGTETPSYFPGSKAGSAVGGALSGGATGFALGGPVGAGVGALAGGLGGWFG